MPVTQKVISIVVSIAPQFEASGHFAGDAPLLEVRYRTVCLRVLAQLRAVIAQYPLHQLVQFRQVGAASRPAGLPGHRQSRPAGQLFHRLGEIEVPVFHEKADGRAVGAAAEAVVELFVRADGEGRRLFVMEGAAGLVVLAGLFQGHEFVNQGDDVRAGQQFVDKLLWDPAGHGRSINVSGVNSDITAAG